MRTLTAVLIVLSLFATACEGEPETQMTEKYPSADPAPVTEALGPDSLLRHVVLFSFKESSNAEDIKAVEAAFHALPEKIDAIYDYEWGLNNSPEGLNKGLTHAFFLTFKSEEDRAIYLPHPDHKAFGEVLGPHLEDVVVVDYWAKPD